MEKYKLEITQDSWAESPREWDNLGVFITKTRNYRSPDEHEEWEEIMSRTGDVAESVEHHMELIKKEIPEAIYITPVSKYEHSGISFSRGVSQGWDSGVCGFYIVTQESADKIGVLEENFDKVIDEELETYTQWCNGDVYDFELLECVNFTKKYKDGTEVDGHEWEHADSCSGFYGTDWHNNGMTDCLPKEAHHLLDNVEIKY